MKNPGGRPDGGKPQAKPASSERATWSVGAPPLERVDERVRRWRALYDNIQREDCIEEFTLSGDSAPSGRFNYRYTTR